MDTADPETRDGFATALRTALQTAETALVPKTRSRRLAIFQQWTDFCTEHGRQPSLSDVPDPETRLCYLLVFGSRIRSRASPATGKAVRAGSVASALLAVGQGITALGVPDPRKEAPGADRNHPLLASYLKALQDADDPSTRAYPANITIIQNLPEALDTEHPQHGRLNLHVIDLCIIGFFWLLRPAEYLLSATHGRSQAFRLQDVSFLADGRLLPAADAPLNDWNVSRITRASLTFHDQKNAVRGEQISHAATNHPQLCPCKALARICAHLRAHAATPDTPIYTYYNHAGQARHIEPHLITNALRHSAHSLYSTTGIPAELLSARSLRPGGATALLCAGVDADVIQLLGRWKSDAMLRYLRVAATANTHNFAQHMLTAGAYTFAPNTYDNNHYPPVPREAPRPFLDAIARETLYHD